MIILAYGTYNNNYLYALLLSRSSKRGHSKNGIQRWYCKSCKKYFQLTYCYKARGPGVKGQIDLLALNSPGARDTARVLGVNKDTVVAHLKKRFKWVLTCPITRKPKTLKVWKWTSITRQKLMDFGLMWAARTTNVGLGMLWTNPGIILDWANGKRTGKSFEKLLALLKDTPIGHYYTDGWGAYSRLLPNSMHTIGKDLTWKIERKDLNFRTHIKRLNRKTICFSKDEKVHDNVIGMYIEKYYYGSGTFGKNQPN